MAPEQFNQLPTGAILEIKKKNDFSPTGVTMYTAEIYKAGYNNTTFANLMNSSSAPGAQPLGVYTGTEFTDSFFDAEINRIQ